jgi:hypothetical protein
VPIVLKSGSLNLLVPSGPVSGNALPSKARNLTSYMDKIGYWGFCFLNAHPQYSIDCSLIELLNFRTCMTTDTDALQVVCVGLGVKVCRCSARGCWFETTKEGILLLLGVSYFSALTSSVCLLSSFKALQGTSTETHTVW